jgi:hypothetical protein
LRDLLRIERNRLRERFALSLPDDDGALDGLTIPTAPDLAADQYRRYRRCLRASPPMATPLLPKIARWATAWSLKERYGATVNEYVNDCEARIESWYREQLSRIAKAFESDMRLWFSNLDAPRRPQSPSATLPTHAAKSR